MHHRIDPGVSSRVGLPRSRTACLAILVACTAMPIQGQDGGDGRTAQDPHDLYLDAVRAVERGTVDQLALLGDPASDAPEAILTRQFVAQLSYDFEGLDSEAAALAALPQLDRSFLAYSAQISWVASVDPLSAMTRSRSPKDCER